MKKIITAINNPNLNKKLNEEKDIDVVCKDIQYKEAIIEILNKEKDIDIIIINNNIPGEIKNESLIKRIKEINEKVKLIYILEKDNENIRNILKENNINNIFNNSEITIKKLIEIIKENNINSEDELKREINELKKIVLENKKINYKKNNKILEKIKNKLNKFFTKIKKNKIIKNLIIKIKNLLINKIINKTNINKKINNNKIKNKVITVYGPPNVGKTTFIVNLSKLINNKKIIIIDFDINKPNIYKFFGIKKYSKKINKFKLNNEKNINKLLLKNTNNFRDIKELINFLLIKINKKINIISGIDLLFKYLQKCNDSELKIFYEKFFELLKKEYDLILIDIGNKNNKIINYNIFENSDLNILITEGNLIGINKAKMLLEKYNNIKNLNIIINKKDTYCIDKKILNKIFDYNILGFINYKKIYSNFINNNYKNIFLNYKNKEYKKIIKNILI